MMCFDQFLPGFGGTRATLWTEVNKGTEFRCLPCHVLPLSIDWGLFVLWWQNQVLQFNLCLGARCTEVQIRDARRQIRDARRLNSATHLLYA